MVAAGLAVVSGVVLAAGAAEAEVQVSVASAAAVLAAAELGEAGRFSRFFEGVRGGGPEEKSTV